MKENYERQDKPTPYERAEIRKQYLRRTFEKIVEIRRAYLERRSYNEDCTNRNKRGSLEDESKEIEEDSDEIKKEISERMMGSKNHFFGKHHSQETKDIISKIHKGKKISKETKQKMSENASKHNLGKKLSDEQRKKISDNHADFSGENHPQFGMINENAIWFGRKRKNSASKYYGVCIVHVLSYIYWKAVVKYNRKCINVGQFKLEIDAAKAYDKYVVENNLPL